MSSSNNKKRKPKRAGPAQLTQDPQNENCSIHRGNILKTYCLTCKCLLCDDCLPSHSKHETLLVRPDEESILSMLSDEIYTGKQAVAAGKELSQKTKLYLTFQKKNTDNASTYISSKYKDIADSANDRQKYLLDETQGFKDTCLKLKKDMTAEVDTLSSTSGSNSAARKASIEKLKEMLVQVSSMVHLHAKIDSNEVMKYISSISKIELKRGKVGVKQMRDPRYAEVSINKKLVRQEKQNKKKSKACSKDELQGGNDSNPDKTSLLPSKIEEAGDNTLAVSPQNAQDDKRGQNQQSSEQAKQENMEEEQQSKADVKQKPDHGKEEKLALEETEAKEIRKDTDSVEKDRVEETKKEKSNGSDIKEKKKLVLRKEKDEKGKKKKNLKEDQLTQSKEQENEELDPQDDYFEYLLACRREEEEANSKKEPKPQAEKQHIRTKDKAKEQKEKPLKKKLIKPPEEQQIQPGNQDELQQKEQVEEYPQIQTQEKPQVIEHIESEAREKPEEQNEEHKEKTLLQEGAKLEQGGQRELMKEQPKSQMNLFQGNENEEEQGKKKKKKKKKKKIDQQPQEIEIKEQQLPSIEDQPQPQEKLIEAKEANEKPKGQIQPQPKEQLPEAIEPIKSQVKEQLPETKGSIKEPQPQLQPQENPKEIKEANEKPKGQIQPQAKEQLPEAIEPIKSQVKEQLSEAKGAIKEPQPQSKSQLPIQSKEHVKPPLNDQNKEQGKGQNIQQTKSQKETNLHDELQQIKDVKLHEEQQQQSQVSEESNEKHKESSPAHEENIKLEPNKEEPQSKTNIPKVNENEEEQGKKKRKKKKKKIDQQPQQIEAKEQQLPSIKDQLQLQENPKQVEEASEKPKGQIQPQPKEQLPEAKGAIKELQLQPQPQLQPQENPKEIKEASEKSKEQLQPQAKGQLIIRPKEHVKPPVNDQDKEETKIKQETDNSLSQKEPSHKPQQDSKPQPQQQNEIKGKEGGENSGKVDDNPPVKRKLIIKRPPRDIINLKETEITAQSISLSWEDKRDAKTTYHIFKRKSDQKEFEALPSYSGENKTCSITNLIPNTEYDFILKVENSTQIVYHSVKTASDVPKKVDLNEVARILNGIKTNINFCNKCIPLVDALIDLNADHKNRSESGNRGGVEIIRELMRRNTSNAVMCLTCCNALSAMLDNCPKNQILACKCGVEKVMFTAMNMHKGDTILYECALNVLKTMSIKTENRALMGKSGVIKEIAHIINEKSSDEMICGMCCEILKNLFYEQNNKNTIAHELIVVPLLKSIKGAKSEQFFETELILLNSLLSYMELRPEIKPVLFSELFAVLRELNISLLKRYYDVISFFMRLQNNKMKACTQKNLTTIIQVLHDRSGQGEDVVLCAFNLIFLLIEKIDENQNIAKRMGLWNQIEIPQEAYFSNQKISSLYIKILLCLAEPRNLLPSKDKPDGKVMSIALALRETYNDPGSCQAGLSLLQSLSINTNSRTYLCACVDPSLISTIFIKHKSNNVIRELCLEILFLLSERFADFREILSIIDVAMKGALTPTSLRCIFGILSNYINVDENNSLDTTHQTAYINLASAGLGVHYTNYEMCYNIFSAILLLITKYKIPTLPSEFLRGSTFAILENIKHPDICYLGCQIFKNVCLTVPTHEKQALVDVATQILRKHIGFSFIVNIVTKFYIFALNGDPLSQSTACRLYAHNFLIFAIRRHSNNPPIVSSCCVSLSILYSLPSMLEKYCTDKQANAIEEIAELNNDVYVLIKSLCREDNEYIRKVAKKGKCTNSCLGKGAWVPQKLYRCLTCKDSGIVCESCRRAYHGNHDCIEFFYIGRCSTQLGKKQ